MSEQSSEPLNRAEPFFVGAPWVPKFCGQNVNYDDWESQMCAMLCAQKWSEDQQCDFILSALEGEPCREILILEQAIRDSPDKIFQQLWELYGDKTSVGSLRVMFYNCRQRPEESVRTYALRLRELGHWLPNKEPQDRHQKEMKFLLDTGSNVTLMPEKLL